MQASAFVKALGASFFTGVPDSLLRPLCDELMATYGVDPRHHVIAANEGNCAALAAGYYLSTGKAAVVYMQNSGEGNAINPMASLLHPFVYGIPVIFVIGWRGEPGVKDEPQHVAQGEITGKLLDVLGISYTVINEDTQPEDVRRVMKTYREEMEQGQSVAFVVRKQALIREKKETYKNQHTLLREAVIEAVTQASGDDPIVSTTGKASRELFEIRVRHEQDHSLDFLTVGSMGHASSIAMGIAAQKPHTRVWCLDGDGAAIMHMGAMGVIGGSGIRNLVHVVIDNAAHETVGGLPTVSNRIHLARIAEDCGYEVCAEVFTMEELKEQLEKIRTAKQPALTFLQVHCALGSRGDLGRPTTTPMENRDAFMAHLKEKT